MKRLPPTPDPGAPAYMLQYTAVMMLLLAFFISILSNARSSTRKAGMQSGIGAIRNSFGVEGGLGLMPYVKAVKNFNAQYPTVEKPKAPTDRERSRVSQIDSAPDQGLFNKGFLNMSQSEEGISLRIATPIQFAGTGAALTPQALEFVQRLTGVLLSSPGTILTVRSYCHAYEDALRNQLLATERSAAIARYLEQSGVPGARVRAVGYASGRYTGALTPEQLARQQGVFLFINKPSTNATSLSTR